MIKQLSLKNFGKHKAFQLDFKEGINILLGKNRRGKTTILEGISYASYGKTTNSTKDRVINYDAKSATSELTHSDFTAKRTRTKGASSLEKIKKNELDSKLNISYEEYLRIFYISPHESATLFDASYLKKFLISLFNLEKYTVIYSRLRTELATLQEVITNTKKVNKTLYTKRFVNVKTITQKYREKKDTISKEQYKYLQFKEKINIARGKLSVLKDEYNKKLKKLNWDKCYACDKPVTKEDKKKIKQQLLQLKPKLVHNEKLIAEKYSKVVKILDKYATKIGVVENKISQGRNLLYTIKEKLKDEPTKRNDKRIKEITSISSVFSNNGFPAHLLQAYTPVIQETANNLLRAVLPEMSIKIRKFRPNSNIPDFKVKILKKGVDVGTLDDISGSEAVWVNLCLRLGIIVMYKQLQNTCLDFLIIDEGFDKLDDDDSLMAISLLRNFIKLGYLKQIIIVTHKAKLKKLSNVNYIEL